MPKFQLITRYSILHKLPGLLITVSMLACSGDTKFPEDHSVSQPNSPEEQAIAVIRELAAASRSSDLEKIVSLHSDQFVSEDAVGKEGVRKIWKVINRMTKMGFVSFNLESAVAEVTEQNASVTLLDYEGNVEMRFLLKKEDENGWLIVGAPEEEEAISLAEYRAPHGDECLEHQDYYRCWNIKVPSSRKGSFPLLIDLHGHEETPEDQKRISGFDKLSEIQDFIAVWPYGIGKSWNAGNPCCEPAIGDGIDDVTFLRMLIDRVASQHNADISRVYLTGFSAGCSMAQRMAVTASDLVTAVACTSLHLLEEPSPEFTAVPIMIFYGTADTDIYAPSNSALPSAEENFKRWRDINGCEGSETTSVVGDGQLMRSFKNCGQGAEVAMIAIDGADHFLYSGFQEKIETTEMAWEFMSRYRKKQ